jgi:DNA repair exonuclease SbcCD nuclease subunit
MFKFIHAADIHLDSPLKGLEQYEGAPVDQIREATRRALGNLVELAIEQIVSFVLIAGDLYDGDWKEFRTGLFFVDQMRKLREAGIPVYLIAGNHDAANKMTKKLPMPDNVHMLAANKPETVHLESCEVAIHGQSFARSAVLDNLAAGYPSPEPGMFNIGLLHTSATGREGHETYAPCTIDDLRSKQYDYWALGHIHKRELLCQDPPILFPGNLQGRHVRETGPKGCTLVTVDHQSRPHLEPVMLDVFRWEHCRVDVAGAESGEAVLDRVRHQLAKAAASADGLAMAVRIEVSGACPAHRELAAESYAWTNALRDVASDVGNGSIWVEKIALRTAMPVSPTGAQWADGPIGELIQYIGELRSGADGCAALATELEEFKDRLPPELKEGPEALGLDDPVRLRETLDQVEQMLIHQLLGREAIG